MQVDAGTALRLELGALDITTGLPYAGAATVYALLRDVTTDKFWNNTTEAWVASEPTIASNLPTGGEGNGDFSATIPALSTTGLGGHTLRVRLVTTYTEGSEVLVSQVQAISVIGSTTSASSPSVSGVTGTMLAARASIILNDANNVAWTTADLLAWINAGQRDIARLLPAAYAVTISLHLAAGAKQDLPTEAAALVAPTRCLGLDGATPGSAPDLFARSFFEAMHPSWPSDAAGAVTKAVLVDEKAPRVFYVWPPQPVTNTHYLELLVAGVPPGLSALTEALALPDLYEGPLLDYVLFRAFSYETTSQTMLARSDRHYARYLQGLGLGGPGQAAA